MMLARFLRSGVPVARVVAYGRDGTEAYDLVDRLPRGPARAAAWNAYVCQTYADKLLDASRRLGFATFESARLARSLYELVATWLGRAATGACPEFELPRWRTAVRSREELAGMRETLSDLRTHVAFDLEALGTPAELVARLAEIDKRIEAVDALWIERPTPELRGGIAGLLISGIDEVRALGAILAEGGATRR